MTITCLDRHKPTMHRTWKYLYFVLGVVVTIRVGFGLLPKSGPVPERSAERSPERRRKSHVEVDWSPYFYVSSIHETDEQLVAIIRQKTDIGLCENVLKVERKLDTAGYHRVRFACESGSIVTQDHIKTKRISMDTWFTEWVQASKIGVGVSGLVVETGGLCRGASPIDLEVMVLDDDGEQVYEIYRKERGVRCLDYQNYPACKPFKVRVLCK